jgi:hypothetical protein
VDAAAGMARTPARLGLLAAVPFGYYATRSFQKHRRLMRPIVAHFLYDAVLITIAVLIS